MIGTKPVGPDSVHQAVAHMAPSQEAIADSAEQMVEGAFQGLKSMPLADMTPFGDVSVNSAPVEERDHFVSKETVKNIIDVECLEGLVRNKKHRCPPYHFLNDGKPPAPAPAPAPQ